MPWYVLYTNPKAERKTSEQLTKIGIENYCPLIATIRQWSDRKKKIEVPLFSSYIFVNLDEKDRNSVFSVKGVLRYLFWLGVPAIVKDHEIETIKKWLSNEKAAFEIESIRPGDTMIIPDGPFKSHSGIVREVNKNNVRLVLESIGIVLTMKLSE
ncbi:UpxY family transcription antiterminator [Flavobacterium sp.]|uniref:UpxY family transcription antiterminator n=1 Tax=Flavobacterium sp. TaxID=239 RepID=UPI00260A2670|nr:UpxY family transcription antiterminator [Flavobacterium sp.]